jgi:hypothetical protein
LEATDFEDAIRNAVSIGSDTDTLARIAGGIAGAMFGIPGWIVEEALARLDDLRDLVKRLSSDPYPTSATGGHQQFHGKLSGENTAEFHRTGESYVNCRRAIQAPVVPGHRSDHQGVPCGRQRRDIGA